MIIRKATINDIQKLKKFNGDMFPDKAVDAEKYIDFWLSKNNNAICQCLLLEDEKKQIKGQILASQMSYYYNQKKTDSTWLFDLIIEEQLRKSAWGIDLLLKCMEYHPNSCSTGSGPAAFPIHIKLGNKHIGDIRKYVGIVNPIWFINSLTNRQIDITTFPKEITIKSKSFKLICEDDLPQYETPFNTDLMEICREQRFLKWRFFGSLHKYAFYLSSDKDSYAVLRSIHIKGLCVLELVDYRCNNTEEDFEELYQLSKRIASRLHVPIIVCGSSLCKLDKVLEKHHFKAIGRPRPIIGFIKCKDRKDDIANRNFCLVTLADSDGETNWI